MTSRYRGSLPLLLLLVLLSSWTPVAGVDWFTILAEHPKNQTALHAVAKLLNVSPELVQTRMLANDLLQDSPSTIASTQAFYTLISCLEALGEFQQARKTLSMYIAMHPRELRPLLTMAYDYYLEGDFPQALVWYDQAVSRFPKILEGYHGKMLSLMALKKFGEAMEYGRYILSVSPGNIVATLRMGNILYERRDFQTALRYYAQFPGNVDFQLGMGLCHFRLKNYVQAGPLLKAAVNWYPKHSELLSDLRFLNTLEIDDLRKQLADSTDLQVQQSMAKTERLARLYELNGDFGSAADLLAKRISRQSPFKEVARIAGDYWSAARYQEAGTWYLQAVPLSADPWTTTLAAADCFLMAKNAIQASELLERLNQQRPVKELWPYFGRLCFLMKNHEQGRKYFDQLGAETERIASTISDPRPSYLYAIDCYLDAGNYSRAKLLLDRINAFAPGWDLDRKYVRYFSEQKDFGSLLALASKYPREPLMANSKGWTQIQLGEIRAAKTTFRNILQAYPDNVSAKAGMAYTNQHRPWEFFLGYTNIGYGGYQDDRGLVTESLRYQFKKTTSTFSHTRTDVKSLSAGATDFNEDLFGGKFWYQANQYIGVQLHGMAFQNDDVNTDDSAILGGKITYFPNSRWLVGIGFDSSNYNTHRGTQISPYLGYQFNRYFRTDIKALLTDSRGNKMRSSQSTEADSGMLKGTYTPNDHFVLSLGGFWGQRRQAVDSESMYAYNSLDLYKNGGFASFLYIPTNRWKLYLNCSVDAFESESRAAANEKAGAFVSEPSQTSKTVTTGAIYQF